MVLEPWSVFLIPLNFAQLTFGHLGLPQWGSRHPDFWDLVTRGHAIPAGSFGKFSPRACGCRGGRPTTLTPVGRERVWKDHRYREISKEPQPAWSQLFWVFQCEHHTGEWRSFWVSRSPSSPVTFSESVDKNCFSARVCLGGYNKNIINRVVVHNGHLCLLVWEAGKSEIMAPADSVSGEIPPPHRQLSSHHDFTWWRGKGAFLGLIYRGTDSTHEGSAPIT